MRFRLWLVASLIACFGWAEPAAGKLVLKREKDYEVAPERQAEFDRLMFAEAQKLAIGSSGEHRLARMERLAHDYAYGAGANKGWNNEKLLRRMKADGFTIVETLMNTDDGMAAMVVKDARTGRHTIAFRGTDTLLNGWELDPDAYNDLVESEQAEVGVQQLHQNRAVIDRWVREYGKDGKLQVTGHSLGGGLAGLFAARYPDKIERLVTFQAPSQLGPTAERFAAAMAKLPPEERPEVAAVVAVDDVVSCMGEVHVGAPEIILTLSDDMGAMKAYGHLSFPLQNTAFPPMWNGAGPYRRDGDQLIRAEMSYEEFHAFKVVSQIKGTSSLQEKKRKWEETSRLMRICLRDKHAMAAMGRFPVDPMGTTDLPPQVQQRLRVQTEKMLDAVIDGIGHRYVEALRLLADNAPDEAVKQTYEAEMRIWHDIGTDVRSMEKGDTTPKDLAAQLQVRLTRRMHVLWARHRLLTGDPVLGELMLYVAPVGIGRKISDVGADITVQGPSGRFFKQGTRYIVRQLAAGTYRIHVRADGFEPATARVQMTEDLPKKRLMKRVSLRAIPKYKPRISLPAPPGTLQLLIVTRPDDDPPYPVYARLSQPDKRFTEKYANLARFWKLEPGRYQVAALATGYESYFKTVDITAERLKRGWPMILVLRKRELAKVPFEAGATVAAVKAYYEQRHHTLNQKGYSERKRKRIELLMWTALERVRSFPHNEVSKQWKLLHDEIDARADEWREGLTSNRLSAMPNEIREEDRDRLRAIEHEVKELDALVRSWLAKLSVPKDDWDSSPGRVFERVLYDKKRLEEDRFLAKMPHPANWKKGSDVPITRLQAALDAMHGNFRHFAKRRTEIEAMLVQAMGLERRIQSKVERLEELAQQMRDLVKRKRRGG